MNRLLFTIIFAFFSTFVSADERKKETGDYNFDGHEDYRVFIMQNGRMARWEYFLFNPEDKKYKVYGALTDLWNPRFDNENKKIITFSPGGHSGLVFMSDTYNWKDGDIQLIKSVKQDWDRKQDLYVHKISKRMNGKMGVSKTLFLEYDKAREESYKFSQ